MPEHPRLVPTKVASRFRLKNAAHDVYLSSYEIGTDSRSSATEGTVVGRTWGGTNELWSTQYLGNGTVILRTSESKDGRCLAAFVPGSDARSHAREGTVVTLKQPTKADSASAHTSWRIAHVSDSEVVAGLPHVTPLSRGRTIQNVETGCYLSAYAEGADRRAAPRNESTVVCRPWQGVSEMWLVEPMLDPDKNSKI